MGYLKERHGIEMLGEAKTGACSECGCYHAPELPHNQQSLMYQYRFYDKHGRFPSWADAMEHCDDAMKEYWKKELETRGIKVEQEPGIGTMNAEIKFEKEEEGDQE